MPKAVHEVMTTRIATIGPETRLESILRAFERHPFHHLPVVDGEGRVVGIVSDRDLMRVCANKRADPDAPASSFMTQLVASIEPDASLQEAAKRLLKLGVNSLLILEERRLKGIITSRDIVEAVAAGDA